MEDRPVYMRESDYVNLAGFTLSRGDVVDVAVGRGKIIRATFISFNHYLFVFRFKTDDGEMLLPYKAIKYMVKVGGGEKTEEKGRRRQKRV